MKPSYASNSRRALLGQLVGQASGPATSTDLFTQGRNQVLQQVEGLEERDQRRLSSRGLRGTGAEIASAEQRGQAYNQMMGSLFGAASDQQNSFLAQALQGTEFNLSREDANYWRERELKARKRGQILQALAGAGTAAATAIA
jgi:hypothetical protein